MYAIENRIAQIETHKMKPTDVARDILSELQGASNSLKLAFIDIANVANNDSSGAYHNYTHTAEAMYSIYELAKIEYESWTPDDIKASGFESKEDLILASVMVMAGHDIGHDGRANAFENPSLELEENSAGLVANIIKKHKLPDVVEKILMHSILATKVDQHTVKTNISNYIENPKNPVYVIAQMAAESDLAASISRHYGPTKGELLAQEVEQSGNKGLAKGLRSFNGRKFFLENMCHMITAGAKSIGLTSEVNIQIDAMNRAIEESVPEIKRISSEIVSLEQTSKVLEITVPELQTLKSEVSSLKLGAEGTHGTNFMLALAHKLMPEKRPAFEASANHLQNISL